ncbi:MULTISPECIES: extensin family protein [unclassified Sphingomonas]|uniref:extensin-like domain-containing protein n=1 Tax=unclassified Sphingomonas TaxID=196159 RepID=UPI0006F8FF88|nr:MULTISPECIES: extensin family protein [unclassified Sphingomonas]KQN28328.1 extensin [Sphingomonas sp. Leaf34]KQN29672.1 extensin [Sphingomonas sp. Leaf38]
MRTVRLTLCWLVGLMVVATLGLMLWSMLRARPQDLPWTPLGLDQPIGMSTGRKLTALTGDFPQCRALLDRAGVRYTALPPRKGDGQCGYADAVRLTGGARKIAFVPAGLGVACPVAAALSMWEWNVIQPAAVRFFGARVVSIDHFGSYSCRRIYGRDAGTWSEHSTADAVDIAGFRLSDGTYITVARDWQRGGAKSTFLHAVRDGACKLFATTLSPDYNAAHADHLHLDQADRGAMGWRACR